MNAKRNSKVSLDHLDDRVDDLFVLTLETFESVMRKVQAGEIDPTGHLLNTIVTFLEKNRSLLPDIRERRLVRDRELEKLYDKLPTFDDEIEYKPDDEWK